MVESPARSALPRVTRFEGNLLRALRCFVGEEPAEQIFPMLRETANTPARLSSTAGRLLHETLAKGCVMFLARQGGWRTDRFLRAGEVRSGRVWDQRPIDELKLNFTRASIDFLVALVARKPSDDTAFQSVALDTTTNADRLLFALAYQALREEPDLGDWIRGAPIIAGNGLCRLLCPGDFGDTAIVFAEMFEDWSRPPGPAIFEALQPLFESRWLAFEMSRCQVADWNQLRREGDSAARTLDLFLDAIDRAGRRDLARFMLAVLKRLKLADDTSATSWIAGLSGAGPRRLAERLDIQRRAFAFLNASSRLRQWEQDARQTGYFDDDYAVSQFWLSEWERHDAEQSVTRAERIAQLYPASKSPDADQARPDRLT